MAAARVALEWAAAHTRPATRLESGAPETDRDSGSATVEGFACSWRLHLREEQVVRDECFATTAALKLSDRESARLARIWKVMKSWSHSMLPMEAEATP